MKKRTTDKTTTTVVVVLDGVSPKAAKVGEKVNLGVGGVAVGGSVTRVGEDARVDTGASVLGMGVSTPSVVGARGGRSPTIGDGV